MDYEPAVGEVAQLGERSVRIAEVGGSNPLFSTQSKQPSSCDGGCFNFRH